MSAIRVLVGKWLTKYGSRLGLEGVECLLVENGGGTALQLSYVDLDWFRLKKCDEN